MNLAVKRNESNMNEIISKRGLRIEFLVIENKKNEENFVYILMKESEYKNYQNAIKSGYVNPFDHGVVLYNGKGNNPDKKIEEMILDKLIKK